MDDAEPAVETPAPCVWRLGTSGGSTNLDAAIIAGATAIVLNPGILIAGGHVGIQGIEPGGAGASAARAAAVASTARGGEEELVAVDNIGDTEL